MLTVTTTCDFKRGTGGATKHTDTDMKALLFKVSYEKPYKGHEHRTK